MATLPSVGDEQKVSWQELLGELARGVRSGTDFTVAVEEEFALLDPETLELPIASRRSTRLRSRPSSRRTSSAS